MAGSYSLIRLIHIGSVVASGGLFGLKGLAHFTGMAWPTRAPLRYLSYSIDTVLLTTGIMLVTILHAYPFVQAWLTVKLLLLVVYILLGYFALWRARRRAAGIAAFIGAVAVYLFIISVALAYDPLGVLLPLFTAVPDGVPGFA
jgi:uncharacterized membrane protein SirB2